MNNSNLISKNGNIDSRDETEIGCFEVEVLSFALHSFATKVNGTRSIILDR